MCYNDDSAIHFSERTGYAVEYKVCYYCGTKYPAEEETCPLCGGRETEPEAVDETPAELRPEAPAAEPAPRKKKKQGMGVGSTIVCILLALAVIAGTLFILHSLGVIGKAPAKTEDPSLALPVETEEKTVACTGLTVSPEELTFTEDGQKNRLTVRAEPADCTEAIVFESAEPTVASVDEDGEVTAVAPGATAVIISCGEYAKSIPVTCDFIPSVDPDEITTEPAVGTTPEPDTETESGDLTISSEDFTLFYAGETTRLTVSGKSGSVEWSSTDPSVASVQDGTVTAVAPGTATITATVGGESVKAIARCRFEAGPAAETAPAPAGDVTISQEDVTLFSQGETFTLRLLDGDQRLSGVTWSTSDASVCVVDGSGNVTAMGSGQARVSGVYGGVTRVCIVRCSF